MIFKSIYPGGFNYHEQFNAVVTLFNGGLLTEKIAIKKLAQIETKAYKLDRYAEPDGDITLAAAMALHEIRPR